jgi:hypothetical protein
MKKFAPRTFSSDDTPMPHRASKWHSLRRLATSLACALAVVLIASRINRPYPLEILTPTPRPGDEILKSVHIDMRSINASLASLRAVSKTNIIFDKSSLDPNDKFGTADWPDTPPLDLHNAHLRAALAVVLHLRNPAVLELREDAASITVGGPDTSLRPVYLRMYDISDLVPDPPPIQSTRPTNMQRRAISLRREISQAIENLFQECIATDAWYRQKWSLHVWSARLVVAAGDKGQRAVQQMLLMLRTSGTLNPSEGKSTP